MQTNSSSQESFLEFLQPYKVDGEVFSLSSGKQILIQKYFLQFTPWSGEKLSFDFGRKPVLDFDGDACFAELAILKLFLKNGWNGAWIETYGGTHYLNSMPQSWSLKSKHISIPVEIGNLLKLIWKTGKTTACFDVVVWQGNKVFFCEAKRLKKDRLTEAQKKFIRGALVCGIPATSFIIVEWDFK